MAATGLEQTGQRLGPKALILILFVAVDAFVLGGMSLRPPSQALPSSDCVTGLEGGVLIWPLDGRMDDPSLARMLQMHHQQPAPQRGIASWRLNGEDVHRSLQLHGFSDDPKFGTLTWKPIQELGYQNLVVLPSGPKIPIALPTAQCQTPDLAVYRIADLPDELVIR